MRYKKLPLQVERFFGPKVMTKFFQIKAVSQITKCQILENSISGESGLKKTIFNAFSDLFILIESQEIAFEIRYNTNAVWFS